MSTRQHSVANGSRPLPQHAQSLPTNTNASGQRLASAPAATIGAEEHLRRRIIALLAGTANGCIAELRYPELCTRLEQLEKSQPKFEEDLQQANALVSELKKEKEELRLQVVQLRAELDQVRQTGATNPTVDSSSHLTESLQKAKERIEGLEEEKQLLMQQNAMLLKSQTISSEKRYEVLKNKYEYALELILSSGTSSKSAKDQEALSNLLQDRIQPANPERSLTAKASNSQEETDSILSQPPSKADVTSGATTSQRFAEDGTLAHNKGKASAISSAAVVDSNIGSTTAEIPKSEGSPVIERMGQSNESKHREIARIDDQTMEVDAPMNTVEEASGHDHSRKSSDNPDTKSNATEMDEESDDDYGDLTDDDESKTSVMDCIRSVFYANDVDERYCKLCDTRASKGLISSSPAFTDCSLRDLISHLKLVHPLAWSDLRQPERKI